MTYPWWLKALVAFGAPFSMTFVAGDWKAALAAGFGGLLGLVGNDTIKKQVK